MASKTKKKTTKVKSRSLKKTRPLSTKRAALRRRNILISLGVGLVLLCAGSILFITRAATSYTQFVGIGGKCLDNDAQRKLNNNKIQLWTCNTTSAQQWQVNSNGTITNANGYCLDAQATIEKSLARLYQCNGGEAQQWRIDASKNTIINIRSSFCLDAKGAATADGTPLWLYHCNGTPAQKWVARKITPSTTTSGVKAPTGNIKGWKQLFVDDFNGTVPVGAFSDCNHNPDHPSAYCGGLKKYTSYYNNWWAYPNTWPDTAKSKADGNTQAPFGGTYHPEKTVSVSNGVMHIKMYRPKSGGDNVVATVVPRKCMNHKYGRYEERFRVVHADKGFKSAHLFYNGNFEVDYPENDYWQTIGAYTHPGGANFQTKAKWTDWHTSTIEWTASAVKFYMDGKLIGTTKNKVPNIAMNWVLQNESSITGPYAKPGATAQLDIDWVTCYAPA